MAHGVLPSDLPKATAPGTGVVSSVEAKELVPTVGPVQEGLLDLHIVPC